MTSLKAVGGDVKTNRYTVHVFVFFIKSSVALIRIYLNDLELFNMRKMQMLHVVFVGKFTVNFIENRKFPQSQSTM